MTKINRKKLVVVIVLVVAVCIISVVLCQMFKPKSKLETATMGLKDIEQGMTVRENEVFHSHCGIIGEFVKNTNSIIQMTQ